MNTAYLQALKAATIGIGVLVNPNTKPEIQVYGTGFFVNSTGYVMTAYHVIRICDQRVRAELAKKNDVGTVFIWLHPADSGGQFKLTSTPVHAPYVVHLGRVASGTTDQLDTSGAIDLDVAILRPKETSIKDTPFLTIKSASKSNLYDEIAMCGYPSGKHSLRISREVLALRLSPVMQFGKIAGLMPSDSADYPYAIQTDIIGTGGSSGSPIIELTTGQVIAMAQEVLPAGVGGQAYFKRSDKPTLPFMKGEIFATSNIGLVNGLSHNVLEGIPEGAKKEIEQGIAYKDSPKISLTKFEGYKAGF